MYIVTVHHRTLRHELARYTFDDRQQAVEGRLNIMIEWKTKNVAFLVSGIQTP